MDERALKRLLVIVAVSIIAILLFKTMMSRTIINLNKAAEEKRLAARTSAQSQIASPASDAANPDNVPAASATGGVASSEPSASSGVSETR